MTTNSQYASRHTPLNSSKLVNKNRDQVSLPLSKTTPEITQNSAQ